MYIEHNIAETIYIGKNALGLIVIIVGKWLNITSCLLSGIKI